MTEPLRMAVLVSRYPALSHAFIRREIQALRKLDVTVETLSLRTPTREELLTEADREEFDNTLYIQPIRPLALIAAHLVTLARHPARYFSTLGFALGHHRPGAKGRLWALLYFLEAMQVARVLEQRGVQHMHCHFANAGGTVGLFASRYCRIGFSLTMHGLSDFGDPEGQRIAEKMDQSSFVACVSEHGRQQAIAIAGGARTDHIAVVRCGLGTDAFRDRAPDKEPGHGNEPLRLICVGRLAPEKGHVGLVEALAAARGEGLDAELRLIGEGPERPKIEAAVETLGLTGSVELPGAVGGDALRDELEKADLFVLSSLMEGLPVTLMEAMAVGTPVIAPRLSGIPELVREGLDGWLFTTGDFDALAQTLASAGAARSQLAELGRKGREQVRNFHSVERNAAILKDLVADAIAQR